MVEQEEFADIRAVDRTVGIDSMAVAESTLDAPLVGVSLDGTPTALAEDCLRRHRPRTMGTHDDEIGTIAWTQESALADAKETGWIMSHQFNESLYTEYPLVDELEHGDE